MRHTRLLAHFNLSTCASMCVYTCVGVLACWRMGVAVKCWYARLFANTTAAGRPSPTPSIFSVCTQAADK